MSDKRVVGGAAWRHGGQHGEGGTERDCRRERQREWRLTARAGQGIWLVPKGTADIHRMLQQAAVGLSVGGQTGAFTPMYLLVCRKPLK